MIAVHLLTLAVLATSPQQADAAQPVDAGCVALLLPSVEGVEDSIEVATSGRSIKSIELEARLSSQAAQEARLKGCTKILTVTLVRKQSGGGGNKLGAVA